ncbi:MAG: ketosteroid isomerase-like protein [Psychroserpens sp.]|jgi:ketosteroid isomerase-like protein|uniref:nuclear transport factor 2 family protein n=1 Tax=Psychroserpens sp. TaxID=2020870 RepID=UPI0039E2D9FE
MNSIIENFYSAFKNHDAESMVAYYHDDIIFEDAAFGILKGEHAKNMWRMLIASQKGKDFKIEYSEINTQGSVGNAKWEARYNFSKTGRPVHNKIAAHFEFKEGKIIKHTDYFNLHSWSKQAFGIKGFLLGGTLFFKKKIHQQTNQLLTKFENIPL